MSRIYLVPLLKTKAKISTIPPQELEFSELADGCEGVMLAFNSKEKAITYLGDRDCSIFEMEVDDE